MTMFEFLGAAWDLAEHRIAKHKRKKRFFAVAAAFNKAHSYTAEPDDVMRAHWMCPTCNRVHKTTDNSIWTGLQFPACCEFPEGYRWSDPAHACEVKL